MAADVNVSRPSSDGFICLGDGSTSMVHSGQVALVLSGRPLSFLIRVLYSVLITNIGNEMSA